jgi:hypothetical protein
MHNKTIWDGLMLHIAPQEDGRWALQALHGEEALKIHEVRDPITKESIT